MGVPQGTGASVNLKWSQEGWTLYSGGRRDSAICCWDMRRGSMNDCTTNCFPRKATTNQCIGFDLDMNGSLLITGGTDGIIRAYNAFTAEELGKEYCEDTANDVSLSLHDPLLAVSIGQRHFPEITEDAENTKGGCDFNNGNQISRGLCLYRVISP